MFKTTYIVLLFFLSQNVLAVDPFKNWHSIETDYFYIHYEDGSNIVAKKVAAIAENAHKKLSPAIGWVPKDKTHLVISDETDQPNGYATPFPYNRSVIFIAPPDTTNTLEDFDDWLNVLITHEYTHILHLDKNTGAASKLRKLFGRHFLLFPNLYQPLWITEGLATYHETDEEKGIGRGQSSIFEMMMRMEVENGIKPVSQVNLRLRSWPMGTTAYLYGVNFCQYIVERYGEASLKALVDNYSDNIIPFMINSNSEQVLKKDISELWDEFSEWLTHKYQPQINEIKEQGIVAGEAVSHEGYFTNEVQTLSNERTYYLRSDAFKYPALIQINEVGEHEELIEIHRGARMDVHRDEGILLAQPEFCDEFNRYYDLYIMEFDESELKRITECGRYRSAAWSPDGQKIIAVNTEKGISQMHLLNQQGEKISVVWQGKNDEVIAQPDWSENGREIVAAVFRPDAGWNIELFDMESRKWKKITDDPFVDAQPRFDENGSNILFSSDRNGVYNIYSYDLESEIFTQLTNVKGGAFQPSQLNKKSPLYYVNYTANGSDIARLEKTAEKISVKGKEEPGKKKFIKEFPKVSVTEATDYSAWSSLYPRWWFPFISIDENRNQFGFSTAGNDALGIHNYYIEATYDTKNEVPLGLLNYSYANRLQFGYKRDIDILLDQNGNLAGTLREDDAYASIAFPYSQETFRWNFFVAAFTSKTDLFEDNLMTAAITFDNARHYIRSVSANDGRSIRLIAESSDIIKSDFSGEVYTFDWREYLSLGGQHVLAIRLAEAYGTERPELFELGGEDNNYETIDVIFNSISEPPLFGRRDYGLRGYSEGNSQLIGRRMQLGSMEWRFPLDLVERGFMSPPVGLIQYSGSVFVESGAAWQNGRSPDKYYTSTGLELNADVSLFYGLNVKMRMGIAKGLDSLIGENRAYFTLGAAF